MYLLVSKFRFLEFLLLLSRVAPCLQVVTTNCLIMKTYSSRSKPLARKDKADLHFSFNFPVF